MNLTYIMFMPPHFKEEKTHCQAFVGLLVCLSVDKIVSVHYFETTYH